MTHAPNYTALVPWLEGRGRNEYSQFGEDGLIEGCLEKVGIRHRRCFEFGAADGSFLSNTKRLRDDGWDAVLVECGNNWQINGEIIQAKVTTENINRLIIGDFDVGSIDVDGQDYWLWEALISRPSVMVVEYCPYRSEDYVPERGVENPGYDQATLAPIVSLGQRKGYSLVATTFCNAVFIHDNSVRNAA